MSAGRGQLPAASLPHWLHAGIAAVQRSYPNVCVIWVDAHADANTPDTSPSMHYHGMPAAHLMGWFQERLEGFDWFPEGRYTRLVMRGPAALLPLPRPYHRGGPAFT